MKRRTIVILSILIAIFLVLIGVFSIVIAKMEQDYENLEIGQVNLSSVADGTYSGEYGSTLLYVKVSVTVQANEITAIELLEHNNGKGYGAETIPDTVIKAQTLEVDIVTGATCSSKAILKAIENALTGAK